MSLKSNTIICPNCSHQIDVNEVLYHQLSDHIKKEYNDRLKSEKNKIKEESQVLQRMKQEIEQQQEDYQQKLTSEINHGIKQQKKKLELEIKQQAKTEQQDRIKVLQDELVEKSNQVRELNKSKAIIEKLKHEKDELKEKIELEAQIEMNTQLNREKEKIQKNEAEKIELQLSKRDQVIKQLTKQLQDAHRKAEQGSSQLHGEVQELAIEEWLSKKFPLDTIQEIKKGERGADCMQIIHTRGQQNCGTIYYESKRAKNFQPSWIEKFKADIREKNADIGILVTDAMPADMKQLGMKDGVWICSFDEFKGLSTVLRDSVIKLSQAIVSQENRGDKMSMLYDYLTGNEFHLQVEAIVEGFTQMKSDLESEKRSMTSIWKKREKQIEKVLLNTNYMYSSIKGIAGNAIQSVSLLELSPADTEEQSEE